MDLLPLLPPLVFLAALPIYFLIHQRQDRALVAEARRHPDIKVRKVHVMAGTELETVVRGHPVLMQLAVSEGVQSVMVLRLRASPVRLSHRTTLHIEPSSNLLERDPLVLEDGVLRARGTHPDVLRGVLNDPAVRAAFRTLAPLAHQVRHMHLEDDSWNVEVALGRLTPPAALALMRSVGELAAALDDARDAEALASSSLLESNAQGPVSGIPVGIRR